jgi:hypothetical protein
MECLHGPQIYLDGRESTRRRLRTACLDTQIWSLQWMNRPGCICSPASCKNEYRTTLFYHVTSQPSTAGPHSTPMTRDRISDCTFPVPSCTNTAGRTRHISADKDAQIYPAANVAIYHSACPSPSLHLYTRSSSYLQYPGTIILVFVSARRFDMQLLASARTRSTYDTSHLPSNPPSSLFLASAIPESAQ